MLLAGFAFAACSPQAPAAVNSGPDAAVVAGGVQAAAQVAGKAQTGLQEVPLIIHSATGDHRFTVEVAASPGEQERGLMYRTSLAGDRGMIFPWDGLNPASFWMKDTLIPLDIIFIGPDHRIIKVAANAAPMSLDPIPSGGPVSGILELRGGRAAELGIKEGDRVDWTD